MNNKKINMKIDTGADVTVINYETFTKMNITQPLQKSDKCLRSPGGMISIVGMFDIDMNFKGKEIRERIYVFSEENRTCNLLSRRASVGLGIVKFMGNVNDQDVFGFG